MDYFVKIILSRINKELVFRVMKDFRIGGLNPGNYDKFMDRIKRLPNLLKKYDSPSPQINDFLASFVPDAAFKRKLFLIKHIFSDFNLKDVSESESGRIWKRVEKSIYEKAQFCWHPNASLKNCTKDESGNIKISSAHSIQRNKILKNISENNEVKQFKLNCFDNNFDIPIKFASTFYGFCDIHDKIFNPIEKKDYVDDIEQNFLFAYRAFVHSSHIKRIFYEFYDYGFQTLKDINNNKKIFNDSIINKDYYRIVTDLIVLDYEYPIAVVSKSDLDFDFNGKKILHSDTRLEAFFLTVFPQNGKTYVLFSYFKDDSDLYSDIINQIEKRKNIESDLSVLISGHCENVFFKPSYYQKYIEHQEKIIDKLIKQTQFDFVQIDGYGKEMEPNSQTPNNYLNNEYDIQLFYR